MHDVQARIWKGGKAIMGNHRMRTMIQELSFMVMDELLINEIKRNKVGVIF